MRISNNISFKGYDAALLKRIYLEQAYCKAIYNEMSEICNKEDIEIAEIYDFDKWTQDDKAIIEKDGKPYLIGNGNISDNFINQLKNRYQIEGNRAFPFIEGGNTFMGKFPNGQKWMIIGIPKREVLSEEQKKELSKIYSIKAENIFGIPKPNFHLDLGIRPIGFPNILVNDPELAGKTLEKLNDGSREYRKFKFEFDKAKKQASNMYASCDKICLALQDIGFNPIRVAGVFYNGINFMNAIVNQKEDGSLTYITNSSECKNHIYTKLQKEFEKEIKQKVPNINSLYFIKGEENKPNQHNSNYMIDTLRVQNGGIHCMALEEPYFSFDENTVRQKENKLSSKLQNFIQKLFHKKS